MKDEQAKRPVLYPKASYTIAEIVALHGGGRTAIYDSIRDGRLVARKAGRRTIILHDDFLHYLSSLPVAEMTGNRLDGKVA